jgi:hypothetical protein
MKPLPLSQSNEYSTHRDWLKVANGQMEATFQEPGFGDWYLEPYHGKNVWFGEPLMSMKGF